MVAGAGLGAGRVGGERDDAGGRGDRGDAQNATVEAKGCSGTAMSELLLQARKTEPDCHKRIHAVSNLACGPPVYIITACCQADMTW